MASCNGDGSKTRPFFMKQGRKFTLLGTLLLDGIPVDLSNPVRTGRSQLRVSGNPTTGTPAATMTVTITSATAGQYSLTLGATVTTTLEPGLYFADVEFEDTGTPDPDDVIGTDLFYIRVGPQATV